MLVIPPPQSKVHRPRLSPDTVERARLNRVLDAGASGRLTLVCAPAGYGKTTLVANWLDRSQPSAAWVSLDAQDNDLAQFMCNVVTSVQAIVPDIAQDMLEHLTSAPRNLSPQTLALDLIHAFDQYCGNDEPRDVVLVLDDYHLISEPDIHDAVSALIEYLPSEIHLIISSRVDPPLPIPRLRARDDLVELRARDLRFTTEETAEFLSSVLDVELEQNDIHTLHDRTEGWIASLRLAAAALRSIYATVSFDDARLRHVCHDFVASFAGTDRYVVDYLIDEVLSRQSDEIQSFLIQSSALERITAPLCDYALNRVDSAAMLRRLERLNLFLVELDNQRQWYRYHPLFAELLRVLLDEHFTGLQPEITRRATQWLTDHGYDDAAIQKALHGRTDRSVRPIRQTVESAPERAAGASRRLNGASTMPVHMAGAPVASPQSAGDDYALFVDPLTEREQEVLELLVSGQSSPEIADNLFVGVTTVRTHLKNLYRKLDVHSRYEATVRARELGIV